MKNIINQSHEVFKTLEQWKAFYEIQKNIYCITQHWLCEGAKALRLHSKKNFNKSVCEEWYVQRDTCWHIAELDMQSISVGIGWDFELHLFARDENQDVVRLAQAKIKAPESPYKVLLHIIGGDYEYERERVRLGSILSNRHFTPFDEVNDSDLRLKIIAWHAINDTSVFIEKTMNKVNRIIGNEEVTDLIIKLNEECRPK